MFFYISFLRPPPRISDGSISITPQVANDLRTSHLEDPKDLFYCWLPSLQHSATHNAASDARKLTTWQQSSKYKNITIPLSADNRIAHNWRLALSAYESKSCVISLAEEQFGRDPLPVISLPIQLEAKRNKTISSTKQDQIERLYSIPGSEQRNDTLLCIREQTSFDLDKKIWDSGLGLSSWLTRLTVSDKPTGHRHPLIHELRALLTTRNQDDDHLRILELGAGTGIVSICLAALLEKFSDGQNTQVLATDLPSATDLIEHNIQTNSAAYPSVSIEAIALDWDDQILPTRAQEGPADLIVMADVTYNTASFPSLCRTLDALIKTSQAVSDEGRTPAVLLAYKQRHPAERELWPMLHALGIELNLVDSVNGVGGDAVEIWIWKTSTQYINNAIE